jgi:hypothetical protein
MTRAYASKMNRRQFLQKTAGAAAAAVAVPHIVPSSALGQTRTTAPGERIVTGSIGVGNMGFGDMNAFMTMPDVQVVAMCDVKRTMRDRAKQAVDAHYANTDCATYHDFRELVARDDIDAVCIASLDSWHVLHS